MNERITMRNIAAKAGVHVTTVSLALRNHPSLPLRTRTRIQRVASQMGYQPDPALSALVAYRHRTLSHKDKPMLAYVTHWDTRWGWKSIIAHKAFFEGAVEKASLLGYRVEHFYLGEPGITHRRMSDIMHSRGITGIILASHRRENMSSLDFEWPQFSAVRIDFSPQKPQLHMVTNDQSAIIRMAIQRAMTAGYRRIGFVMPRWWDEFVDLAWSAGFLAEQQRFLPRERIPILFFSNPMRPKRSRRGDLDYVVPKELFKDWFHTHRPEVLLSHGPFVQPCLTKLNISVPEDLAFAEIFLEKSDGRIAGVHQNCRRVGEMAVEILAGQLSQHIRGIPLIPTATYVEGTWCDGRSLPVGMERDSIG